MDAEERRRRVRELLVPGGELIGEPGQRNYVRVMQGGYEAAESFFSNFEELGEPEDIVGYDGRHINFGGKNRIGVRRESKSGEPTIDVTIEYVPELRKIKFE